MTLEVTPRDPSGIHDLANLFLAIYGSMLAIALPLCILFIYIMFKNRKTLFKWPFFLIVWHLTITNALSLISHSTCAFPDMMKGDNDDDNEVPDTEYNEPVGTQFSETMKIFFNGICDKAVPYFTLLMAINRLAQFLLPTILPLFSVRFMRLTILITWVVTCVSCAITAMVKPQEKFSKASMSFKEEIGTAVLECDVLYLILQCIDAIIPSIIVLIYVAVCWSIREKRGIISKHAHLSGARNAEDKRLLAQAVVVAAILELDSILKILSSVAVFDSWLQYIFNMLQLMADVFNHTVNAVIFLFFNQTIRNLLPPWITRCCKRNKINERSLSVTHS